MYAALDYILRFVIKNDCDAVSERESEDNGSNMSDVNSSPSRTGNECNLDAVGNDECDNDTKLQAFI
ncbi:hypothetical protein Plhal304r1_c012g0045131 [Plasmopara halstedii]